MAGLLTGEQAAREPAPVDGVRVLVTDLDGTLLGGDRGDRRRLREALDRHPEITLVFATGRGLSSVEEILACDPLVPRPRWIIGDVGASVIDATDMSRLDVLQNQLRSGWPGQEGVRTALARFPELVHQDGVAQDGRCSFYLDPELLSPEITTAVDELGCGWTYSAGRYFDVLPSSASKGNALSLLAGKLQWPMASILVAGDSLNDLSLFELGAHGVIVGNAEPALRERLPPRSPVHRPGRQGAGAILSALEHLGWVEPTFPTVIGYHRPPVHWADGSWQQPVSPNGILPTLQGLFHAGGDGLDAIWAAALVGDFSGGRPGPHRTGLPLAFLPVTPAHWRGYFHRACKETLWPALMSRPGLIRHAASSWADYEWVNAAFADHISAHAAHGATVWLHDYNLWLVPGILRAARPDLRLGLFHHTPFPAPEVFARIPTAEQLRTSLACLDWAGFHTAGFADHFRQALTGVPRSPRVGVHPLPIDRRTVETLARARPPRRRAHGSALVLSVERLDYAKAPLQKVQALSTLLSRRPDLRGRLRFRLVCPPPEPGIRAYDTTRTRLERAVTELNRTWRTADWEPVDYIPAALPFAEVVDHYLAADVFWVTSLADGMNLTAKEFIAAQAAVGLSGMLILSRHTGAASQFAPAAFLTDPHSRRDLVDTLDRALNTPPGRRREHLTQLAGLLDDHTPAQWARRIIAAIRDA
ncbi:trehalose-6-phosphate synthase [Streptomyces sp. NPDC101227]|uniref:trehalose-6-phosphate synthase n=1 Tax=Streptomyces sp. NPDC101227 TaxID=3366136 RepID=UPI0037F57FB9